MSQTGWWSLAAAIAAGLAVLLIGARWSPALRPARSVVTTTHEWPRRRLPRRRPRPAHPASDVAVAAWCEETARSLRAGSTLATAITDAATAHPAMDRAVGPVSAAVARGRSLAEALAATPSDPATAAGLALTVLRSCAELGGPAAAPIERVAATLRTRAAIDEEQRAHSAQAQLSARVLTLVPLALLGLLTLTEPNVRGALGTPAGLAIVTVGAVLNVIGWRWMQHVIGRPR